MVNLRDFQEGSKFSLGTPLHPNGTSKALEASERQLKLPHGPPYSDNGFPDAIETITPIKLFLLYTSSSANPKAINKASNDAWIYHVVGSVVAPTHVVS